MMELVLVTPAILRASMHFLMVYLYGFQWLIHMHGVPGMARIYALAASTLAR